MEMISTASAEMHSTYPDQTGQNQKLTYNPLTGALLAIPASYSQQLCYFDVGGLGSSIWDFIHWEQVGNEGYEKFDVAAFKQYLQSLFTQMVNAGMTQIELSFAQLCDIDAYASGNFSKISPNDIIGVILQQMVTSNVHFPPGVNILNLITSTAKLNKMYVALSFGGENAVPSDFTICGPGETPEGQAQKLVDFMNAYKIASVDFDVEGGNTPYFANQAATVPFFTSLFQLLKASNKKSTLTVQGSLTQTVWGTARRGDKPSAFNGPLKPLFYNQDNQSIFKNLFKGLNLMMYDNGAKYYLDAKVYPDDTIIPDWCIEDWLDVVGPKNANLVHIGFQDTTQYQAQGSSASGHTYYEPNDPTDPLAVKPTDAPGVAGAKIFLQIQRTLSQDGYAMPLTSTFWWPNYDGTRYNPGPNNQAQFVSQEMKDFYSTLQLLGK